MADKPFVTLVLYAYNEARFVVEAVRSLFAQDYPRLEIVLSDDGSIDGTWEIMQRLAADYRGPHRVLLNHNPTNIGIGSQINAAVAMTSGQLILLANADDVSHPDRVTRTVAAWLAAAPHATAVWSTLREIDAAGVPLGRTLPEATDFTTLERAVRRRIGGGRAASLALDRRVFDEFGPLPANLILEDNPLSARAILLGKTYRISEPLVDYRVHNNNISQSFEVVDFAQWQVRNRQRIVWHKSQGVKVYIEILRDLHQLAADRWDPEDMGRARWTGMEKLLENTILRDYYASDTTVGDARKLCSLLRLATLIVKTRIKRWVPFIERRNARWQYRQVVQLKQQTSGHTPETSADAPTTPEV